MLNDRVVDYLISNKIFEISVNPLVSFQSLGSRRSLAEARHGLLRVLWHNLLLNLPHSAFIFITALAACKTTPERKLTLRINCVKAKA